MATCRDGSQDRTLNTVILNKYKCRARNTAMSSATLHEMFHSFPQPLMINAGIALRLSKVRLLPHALQFIIHKSLGMLKRVFVAVSLNRRNTRS
jgi:hypothetical protein